MGNKNSKTIAVSNVRIPSKKKPERNGFFQIIMYYNKFHFNKERNIGLMLFFKMI